MYWTILGTTAGLCLIGLIMVLSSTTVRGKEKFQDPYYYFERQAVWLGVGLAAMFAVQVIGLKGLRNLAWLGMGVITALLVAVLIVGDRVKGSTRWIEVNGNTIQPSELAKYVLIVWVASLVAGKRRQLGNWRAVLLPVGCGVGLVCVLIGIEPDLGTVFIILAIVGSMLVLAGARLHHLAIAVLMVSPILAFFAMTGYHLERFSVFDPSSDLLGSNYQLNESLSTVARGGVLGVGPGASSAKWGFLPEAHKDVIFAVVTEELGIFGAVVLGGLFVLLVACAFRVHRRCEDLFGSLVALGIGVWIGIQAFVNIGVTLGVLPNKGLTLPFVSYGGSSLLVMLVAVGTLLSVAARTR